MGKISETKTLSWWHPFAACPFCGGIMLIWPEDRKGQGGCDGCGQSFELNDNVLCWIGACTPSQKARVILKRRLLSFLHPASSPLLPFRYLTQIRLERYYNRTLSDLATARKWAGHYLAGLELPEGAVILDFGCGRGRNSGILNQLGYRVAGQDMKPYTWWNRLQNCGFQIITAGSSLPWRNASFDLVVEVGVIHYIDEKQLHYHVREIRRILKPGGYWLLLEGNSLGFGAKEMRRQIGRLHELKKIRELTASNGFAEIKQSFEGFYAPYFPITINSIRKIFSPRKLDLSDYDSWLATKIAPERRGLWLLQLEKTGE